MCTTKMLEKNLFITYFDSNPIVNIQQNQSPILIPLYNIFLIYWCSYFNLNHSYLIRISILDVICICLCEELLTLSKFHILYC